MSPPAAGRPTSAVSTLKRWSTRLHRNVYRLSRGRLLGSIGGQPVLLLKTIGRRTGRRRSTPVQYLTAGDAFVVVASNGGAARPPAWWLNLRADPHAHIQVGAQAIDVRARRATGAERAALWGRPTAANRYLDGVARKVTWELPVLVLTPPADEPHDEPLSSDRDCEHLGATH